MNNNDELNLDRPLIGWYGDDFTGAAAVMEALTFGGFPSVLFRQLPTPAQMEKFKDMRGIGIAGIARAMPPQWMDEHLPPIYAFLDELGVPVLHYKTCSTLDSSPETGSIGRAIELGLQQRSSRWVPMLVAAPAIRRFQAFGHLFAAAGEAVYRLDRHPVMSCHPSTPMHESDVCKHLQAQTDLPMGLIDVEQLQTEAGADDALMQRGQAQVISLDTVDDKTLLACGRLIWNNRGDGLFAAGSQGIEYALVRYWQELLNNQEVATDIGGAESVDQLLIVSGSVSAGTAEQIEHARGCGAVGVPIPPEMAFAVADERESLMQVLTVQVLDTLETGQDVALYSAMGPDDPAVAGFNQLLSESSLDVHQATQQLGAATGEILRRVLDVHPMKRVAVCGGDTSGHVMNVLDIFAFTALAAVVPGGSLVRAHSDNPAFDGLQLTLKGGQMGPVDFFQRIKIGSSD
ncbi:MAG: hypothetical protein KTR32_09425 [Granulosicoccus sp.]|nr:hypothetical protein [Granulosicoccus sp.]